MSQASTTPERNAVPYFWLWVLCLLGLHYFDPAFCERCNVQLMATLIIGLVSFFFWFVLRRGFNRNVVVLAVPLVAAYLVMTGMILGGGVKFLLDHPDRLETWRCQLVSGDWELPRSFGTDRG